MPYYSTSSRKTQTSSSSKNNARPRAAHSRDRMAEKDLRKGADSKESIREVTVKLMAMMKAKRECKSSAR